MEQPDTFQGKTILDWFESIIASSDPLPSEMVHFFGSTAVPLLISQLMLQAGRAPSFFNWELGGDDFPQVKAAFRELRAEQEIIKQTRERLALQWLEMLGEPAWRGAGSLIAYSARVERRARDFARIFTAMGPKAVPGILKSAILAASSIKWSSDLSQQSVERWESELVAIFRAMQAKHGESIKVRLRRLAQAEVDQETAWWASKILLLFNKNLPAEAGPPPLLQLDPLPASEFATRAYHGKTIPDWLQTDLEELAQLRPDVVDFFGADALPVLLAVLEDGAARAPLDPTIAGNKIADPSASDPARPTEAKDRDCNSRWRTQQNAIKWIALAR